MDKMTIKVLFGIRHENYKGENAPEALECMSDTDYDDNPDYIKDILQEHSESGCFQSLRIVDIKVSRQEIERLLRLEDSPVVGTVVSKS